MGWPVRGSLWMGCGKGSPGMVVSACGGTTGPAIGTSGGAAMREGSASVAAAVLAGTAAAGVGMSGAVAAQPHVRQAAARARTK